MMSRFILCVFCALLGTVGARAGTVQPATLWYSEQFTVTSKVTGRDYLIQVARPDLSKAAHPPAIYVLDGNLDFGTAARIASPDGSVRSMEPAFVIGIGYAETDKASWRARRMQDLLFAQLPGNSPTMADGALFARFLSEELRPLIEAQYGADPTRAILAGQSFGGLFATNVLLTTPGAFQGYIIGSPSLWAQRSLLTNNNSFKAPKGTQVFVGVGSEETQAPAGEPNMVDLAHQLVSWLQDRDPGMRVQSWVVPDETHYTVTAPFYVRAFRSVLPPPADLSRP